MQALRWAAVGGVALGAARAFGWNAAGHMVIAEIAWMHLRPEVRVECERLAKVNPTHQAYDFITAAAWADDIRSTRKETADWHFINLHFRLDGQPVLNRPTSPNVVEAIESQSKLLVDRTRPDRVRADALRFLVHLVGDIHQPLHTTARDSNAFPRGDRGGNDFKLGRDASPGNLHALWDGGAGLFPAIDRPLNALTRQLIDVQAKTISALVPEPSAEDLNKPVDEWADEGSRLSQRFVYQTPEGKPPTAAYLAAARTYCAQEAGLAGYRLADLLNRLLAKSR